MDQVDDAKRSGEMYLAAALSGRPVYLEGTKSLKRCIDCGCKIPAARRKAIPGCERCVRCQTEYEAMG